MAAGILGVCSVNKGVGNCPKSRIAFPTYEIIDGFANFPYKIDPGDLGDISAGTVSQAVDDMLQTWEATSTLNFTKAEGGSFDSDINQSNYLPILEPESALGFSPIIFDDDGSIVQDMLGAGAQDNVLGFASGVFYNISNSGKIQSLAESHSLFNGFLYTLSNRPEFNNLSELTNEFKSTILHEFGHMVGLDHSQGGEIDTFNSTSNPSELTHFPIMFPVAGNPLLDLQKDDIAAISIGYPKDNLASSTGTIKGRVLKNGLPVDSINVIAYNVDNSLVELVTSISDIDGQGVGAFNIPFLSPGDYVLKAEPLDSIFKGGSSVGIHAPPTDSFLNTGFYTSNDSGIFNSKSLQSGLDNATRITVSAGGVVEGITIEIGSVSGGDPAPSFFVSGRALTNVIFLPNKSRISSFKIKKLGSGLRNIKLSTDYPELISFLPSEEQSLANKQKSKTVKVAFASFSDFESVFPTIEEDGGATITLRVEDLDTGYVDESQSFFVF